MTKKIDFNDKELSKGDKIAFVKTENMRSYLNKAIIVDFEEEKVVIRRYINGELSKRTSRLFPKECVFLEN